MIIGIDGGLNGAITVLDDDKKIVEKQVMPTIKGSGNKKFFDLNNLKTFLKKYSNARVILEKAQPHFRDGKKQAFKTGYGFGALEGLLTGLDMSYVLVSPKEWQRHIFKGMGKDTKTNSILYCKKRFPKEDWTATKRSKKEHDGLTDSACIAIYGGNNL